MGLSLLSEVPRSHRHHTRYDISGRIITLPQTPLPDNTQHSKETDIYSSYGIRTRSPSKRVAVDSVLWLLVYWGQLTKTLGSQNKDCYYCCV
jgi:hypothetical protein